ncbi:MAG TPA: c-type cytochrome, partial [Nevskiaceae bacterium]|nr:c-type cytochrome [Nevskiaceae bacterium]
LSTDPAARSLGRAIFLNNCAGCHGADAKGARGFPNLTDHDWLYGGKPDDIVASITHGRNGQMPPFNGAIPADVIDDLVATVTHWSDASLDPAVRERGMKQFAITCAACHGADGKGNPLLGSANLTDDIWLHGGSKAHVRETILYGRRSAMPAHEKILSADDIRVVAAYVYGLSQQP